MGLSMIPPELVSDAFAMLIGEMPVPITDVKFTAFTDYIWECYASEDARFPSSIWAAAPSDNPRTTNSAEGFHKQFNDSFHGSHPNIFALKEALLDIQASTYIRIQTIRQGILAKRDPAVLKRVEVAKNAWQEVVRGERTLYKYLKRVGFLYFEEEK